MVVVAVRERFLASWVNIEDGSVFGGFNLSVGIYRGLELWNFLQS
jgi:hypothetical protein